MPAKHFKITQGIDIPVRGRPAQTIEDAPGVESVAVLGADYVGLEPKMLVTEGDQVKLGQPLFHQKQDPAILFTAPASGTVTHIHRGERRVLKSAVIRIDGSDAVEADWATPDEGVAQDQLRTKLLESGLWTAFRTRPYSRIPGSNTAPRSIFVTACDTRPLSADPILVVANHKESFGLGLDLLAKLAEQKVFLCTSTKWTGPTGTAPSIEHVEFQGPHPAGLPGTHIHYLDPVGPEPDVWHIGYQDVIAIGKLIGEGVLWTERTVSIGGEGFKKPRMLCTRLGADIVSLTKDELTTSEQEDATIRLISGCVLNGRTARGAEAFLGRYHMQISAVPQKLPQKWRPWKRPSENRYSFSDTLARLNKKFSFTTDQNGRATALVPTDTFERLIPMDILAAPLLKALLIQDTDQAQALGALELDEEDLALCSFVCPGKNDYAAVLRHNLETIEKNG
jgi:Na+-transporting NADH:ubiquinone oxidoreductase subunit A